MSRVIPTQARAARLSISSTFPDSRGTSLQGYYSWPELPYRIITQPPWRTKRMWSFGIFPRAIYPTSLEDVALKRHPWLEGRYSLEILESRQGERGYVHIRYFCAVAYLVELTSHISGGYSAYALSTTGIIPCSSLSFLLHMTNKFYMLPRTSESTHPWSCILFAHL